MKKEYLIPAVTAAAILIVALAVGMYFIGKNQAETPHYQETESIRKDEPADEVVEDEDSCSGWTSEYLWCSCPHAKLPRKSLAKVRITGASGHKLTGTPI